MEWNRVWACGKSTYLRVYPNPGVSLCLGRRRLVISRYGGIEWFRLRGYGPDGGKIWFRLWCRFSSLKRPGAKG